MIKTEESNTMLDTDAEPSKLDEEEEAMRNTHETFLPSEMKNLKDRDDTKKKESAAVKIQSHVRRRKSMKHLEERELAIVKIQSHVRMRTAIYEYRTLKGAAIAVVAGNEVEQQKDDDKTLSLSTKEEDSKEDLDAKKKESAAVKIQSHVRRRKSMKHLEERELAIVKIQSHVRMRTAIYEYRTLKGAAISVVAGNEVEQQKDNDKTLSLSTKEEDSKEDLDAKEKESAAVKIQSHVRMRTAIYEYRTLKGAAISVIAGNEVEAKTELEPEEVVSDSLFDNEETSDEFVVEPPKSEFDRVLETTSEEEVTLEPVKSKNVSPEADAVVGKVGCGACILM